MTFLQYIWRKKNYIYILDFLKFFIYILYLFNVQHGEVLPGFPAGRFVKRSADTVHFLGISLLGNWVKFLYFLQWLSPSFVFVSMFVICLLIIIIIIIIIVIIIIIIIIIWLVLIKHIRFCWCELLQFKLTWNKELHYIALHKPYWF